MPDDEGKTPLAPLEKVRKLGRIKGLLIRKNKLQQRLAQMPKNSKQSLREGQDAGLDQRTLSTREQIEAAISADAEELKALAEEIGVKLPDFSLAAPGEKTAATKPVARDMFPFTNALEGKINKKTGTAEKTELEKAADEATAREEMPDLQTKEPDPHYEAVRRVGKILALKRHLRMLKAKQNEVQELLEQEAPCVETTEPTKESNLFPTEEKPTVPIVQETITLRSDMTVNLVSSKYDFNEFCNHMRDKDPLLVMDAASAEISLARRLHRKSTKDSDFRKGSKGRRYCDNLRALHWMLINGSVPADSTPEFLVTVKPLIWQILQKWEIGSLRQIFENVQSFSLPDTVDTLVIVVSRAEVEAMDTSIAFSTLKKLLESPATARAFMERVDIAFHGYDQTSEELFEITEVRNYVYKLDEDFPYWLFFLSKTHLGLQCLSLCFLPPFLNEKGRARVFPERINELLIKRWFPAMNEICLYVGYSEKQIEQLTDRALAYITTGQFI